MRILLKMDRSSQTAPPGVIMAECSPPGGNETRIDNRQTNRNPHWMANGNTLTVKEHNYSRERRLAGYEVTASGLSVFLATNGVELAKGTLKSKFPPGTNFKLTPRGTKLNCTTCSNSSMEPSGGGTTPAGTL